MDDFVYVTSINDVAINSNHYIFNFREYIDDIAESYGYTWFKVWSQFLIDFPRISVHVDNEEITDPCELFIRVRKNKTPIIMCTQAALFMPFKVCYQLYSIPDSDIMVVNGNGFRTMVNIAGESLTIIQRLVLKDCSLNETLKTINMSVEVSLSEEFGILNWQLDDV